MSGLKPGPISEATAKASTRARQRQRQARRRGNGEDKHEARAHCSPMTSFQFRGAGTMLVGACVPGNKAGRGDGLGLDYGDCGKRTGGE